MCINFLWTVWAFHSVVVSRDPDSRWRPWWSQFLHSVFAYHMSTAESHRRIAFWRLSFKDRASESRVHRIRDCYRDRQFIIIQKRWPAQEVLDREHRGHRLCPYGQSEMVGMNSIIAKQRGTYKVSKGLSLPEINLIILDSKTCQLLGWKISPYLSPTLG